MRIFQVEMEFIFFCRWQLEHGVRQDAFTNAPQPPGAELVFDRFIHHEIQHFLIEAQLDTFQFEQLFILTDQRILRLGEDGTQGGLVQRIEMGHDGQPTQQFGDQAERFEVRRIHVLQQVLLCGFLLFLVDIETNGVGIDPAGDDFVYAVERPAANE